MEPAQPGAAGAKPPQPAGPQQTAPLASQPKACPATMAVMLATLWKVPAGHVKVESCLLVAGTRERRAVTAWSRNPDHNEGEVTRLVTSIGKLGLEVIASAEPEALLSERIEAIDLELRDLDGDGFPELLETLSSSGGGYDSARLNVYCRAGTKLFLCLDRLLSYDDYESPACSARWALAPPDSSSKLPSIVVTGKAPPSRVGQEGGVNCVNGRELWRFRDGKLVADSPPAP